MMPCNFSYLVAVTILEQVISHLTFFLLPHLACFYSSVLSCELNKEELHYQVVSTSHNKNSYISVSII